MFEIEHRVEGNRNLDKWSLWGEFSPPAACFCILLRVQCYRFQTEKVDRLWRREDNGKERGGIV